jgi:hypothetical protein
LGESPSSAFSFSPPLPVILLGGVSRMTLGHLAVAIAALAGLGCGGRAYQGSDAGGAASNSPADPVNGTPASPATTARMTLLPTGYGTIGDACSPDGVGRSSANAKGVCWKDLRALPESPRDGQFCLDDSRRRPRIRLGWSLLAVPGEQLGLAWGLSDSTGSHQGVLLGVRQRRWGARSVPHWPGAQCPLLRLFDDSISRARGHLRRIARESPRVAELYDRHLRSRLLHGTHSS